MCLSACYESINAASDVSSCPGIRHQSTCLPVLNERGPTDASARPSLGSGLINRLAVTLADTAATVWAPTQRHLHHRGPSADVQCGSVAAAVSNKKNKLCLLSQCAPLVCC